MLRSISLTRIYLAAALYCAGCSGGSGTARTPLALTEGCNPLLAGKDCFYPYPSDFYRVPDASLGSGSRIETKGAAKLWTDDRHTSADVTDWGKMDGFSRLSAIETVLGTAVGGDKLPGVFDSPEMSLSPTTSATLLIDAASGKTVTHFADLDPRARDPEHQALVIAPHVKLDEKARYVVAIVGLKTPDGAPVPPPEGFRRLRDRETAQDPALDRLKDHYERDIFPVAEKAGAVRGSLILAWDFTTGADQHATSDMLRIREMAIAANAAEPPSVTIEAIEEPGSLAPKVWRFVRGTVSGPLFLTSNRPAEGALARDEMGRVRQNGRLSFPFVALIPASARDEPGPVRMIGYGHGFFGSRREVEQDSPSMIADRLHAVLFAIDWWGMSMPDSLLVADALVTRPAELMGFTDGVHQAMANWLTTAAALSGALARQPAFHRPEPGQSPASSSGPLIYDPSRQYFIGISQGALLGGVAASIVPSFSRVVLNVGGAGFLHMMFRAKPFAPFLALMNYSMSDPLLQQKFTATTQRHFDRIDAGIYARMVLDEPLAGSDPDRRVLLQLGLGDTSVPWIAGYLYARILRAGLTQPSAAAVWGLDPYGDQRAAVTVFDLGVDTSFGLLRQPPMFDTPVHDRVRRLDSALRQMDTFLRPNGAVIHPCDGPCRSG